MRTNPAARVTGETVTDSGDLLIIRWTWETGAESIVQALPWPRSIRIRQGQFSLSQNGQSQTLGPGDSCTVPAGRRHQLRCLASGISFDSLRRTTGTESLRQLELSPP